MKLISAEYTFDNAKVLFYFTAECRVDFRELVKIHENIVVKIPMTVEGLKAVSVISKEGIHTNVTLIFSANQPAILIVGRIALVYFKYTIFSIIFLEFSIFLHISLL